MPSSTSATSPGWRTAAAVAAIVAGLLAVDRAAGAVLGAVYARSSANPARAAAVAQADTVVVGTSSAKYAFDPAAWGTGRLVNLAQDGQTIVFSIAAARVVADAPEVRRIIVGIDPYDLNSGLANPSATRLWRIAPAVARIPELHPLLAETQPRTAPLLALDSWVYRGMLDDIARGLRRSALAFQPLGPGNPEQSPPDPPGHRLTFSASLEREVQVLADLTRRPGLQVILVVTPAYRDDRANRPAQAALLADLRQRLGSAPVCDLTGLDTPALRTLRDDAGNFHDAIHLTGGAAAAYTRIMEREIGLACQNPA